MEPHQGGTQTIHVRFFDVATQKEFASSDIPLSQLPASFEARTTMQMSDESWEVVEARPPHAKDFGGTGKLDLMLRKVVIQTLDLMKEDILYSLPTLSDALPALAPGMSKIGKQTVEMHEDDWRQIEWISASMREAAEREFALIRNIWKTQRTGAGFRTLHTRSFPNAILPPGISLDDLRSALGPRAAWLDGAAVRGSAGMIAQSFAVRLLSSIEIYGTIKNGAIELCCFAGVSGNNALQVDIPGLVEFAGRHHLVLVDWCRAMAVEPVLADYEAYFMPQDSDDAS